MTIRLFGSVAISIGHAGTLVGILVLWDDHCEDRLLARVLIQQEYCLWFFFIINLDAHVELSPINNILHLTNIIKSFLK